MGHSDYQAMEIFPNEDPYTLMKTLGEYEIQCNAGDSFFRAYHTFRHKGKTYLHVGWNNASGFALGMLTDFAEETNRHFFSSLRELIHLPSEKRKAIFEDDADPDFEEEIWALDKTWLDEALAKASS